MNTLQQRATRDVTLPLKRARAGSEGAAGEFMSAVYGDLRRLARRVIAGSAPGGTLQPTALVNEAFLRLFHPTGEEGAGWQSAEVDWQDRAHFLAVAARQLRHVLVDHARQRRAVKRNFGFKISIEDAAGFGARLPFFDGAMVRSPIKLIENMALANRSCLK